MLVVTGWADGTRALWHELSSPLLNIHEVLCGSVAEILERRCRNSVQCVCKHLELNQTCLYRQKTHLPTSIQQHRVSERTSMYQVFICSGKENQHAALISRFYNNTGKTTELFQTLLLFTMRYLFSALRNTITKGWNKMAEWLEIQLNSKRLTYEQCVIILDGDKQSLKHESSILKHFKKKIKKGTSYY